MTLAAGDGGLKLSAPKSSEGGRSRSVITTLKTCPVRLLEVEVTGRMFQRILLSVQGLQMMKAKVEEG